MSSSRAPGTTDGRPAGLGGRREALLAWFEARARRFPWREERTPYRVWIAETMLQQTRAASVAPYFARWLARFPDVRALAAADEGEVLAAWEGLGYYRRARALHRAAREIVERHDGRLPSDEAGWRALPGVGPYTAAAIAALAHGRRTVAVDANVRRVGARLTARPRPRDDELRELLRPLIPDRDPGRGTEALIELGAIVCTPRDPGCERCPLQPACAGAATGEPTRFPAQRTRDPVPVHRRWARIALSDGRLWLARRPGDGLLGGLWGVPQSDAPLEGRALDLVRHAYSHFRLELIPVVVEVGEPRQRECDDARWVSPDELDALPMSVVDRKLLARLIEAGLLASDPC